MSVSKSVKYEPFLSFCHKCNILPPSNWKSSLTSWPENPILREIQQNHGHRDLILHGIPNPVIDNQQMWPGRHNTQKISLHCLNAMNVSLRHNLCSLLRYRTQKTDIQRQIIDQHLSAELQYSCRYWGYHLEQSKAQVWKIEEVLTLPKNHFLHWLEAFNLTGFIQETIGMIDALQSGIGVSLHRSTSKRLLIAS